MFLVKNHSFIKMPACVRVVLLLELLVSTSSTAVTKPCMKLPLHGNCIHVGIAV